MLKVELHAHSADDPQDLVPYSTSELIERASALGYDALAITLHDRQLDLGPWREQAEARGIVLIPGVERTIAGRHVLLLNFPAVAERVESLDQVRALKREFAGGLVIAPHPFYPGPSCLGRVMDRYPDLFDAVELTWFYTAGTTHFNDRALAWARAHRRPVVANADVHRLRQLGTTYSLIDASPDPASICQAVRAGAVALVTEPIGAAEAAFYFASLTAASLKRRGRALLPLPSRPAGAEQG